MAKKKEFDRYKEMKYVGLWYGLPAATIIILNYLGMRDAVIIGGLLMLVVILATLNSMK